MTEENPQIKIFASDDNLKTLGELLSNDTGRKIITNLMERQMYTNEIATKLDIRVSLVIHHLKKLEILGLLDIEDKKIKRKGEDHRFFKMNSDIFITLSKSKEEIKEIGVLQRIFKDTVRFAAVGIAAITSFVIQSSFVSKNTWSNLYNGNDLDLELPLSIIIIGLVIERIYIHFKNKKRM